MILKAILVLNRMILQDKKEVVFKKVKFNKMDISLNLSLIQ
jgi:hypothetical protein